MQNVRMIKSQNLCQSCGLCCDGTLFDSVGFGSHDSTIPLEVAGIELHARENEQYFKQPCAAYNKICTVYQHRPQICQNYQCKLLRQLQQHEITWEAATTIVTETIRLRDELKNKIQSVMELPHNASLKQTTHAFDATQRQLYGASIVKHFREIYLHIAVLQVRLERFFQTQKSHNS